MIKIGDKITAKDFKVGDVVQDENNVVWTVQAEGNFFWFLITKLGTKMTQPKQHALEPVTLISRQETTAPAAAKKEKGPWVVLSKDLRVGDEYALLPSEPAPYLKVTRVETNSYWRKELGRNKETQQLGRDTRCYVFNRNPNLPEARAVVGKIEDRKPAVKLDYRVTTGSTKEIPMSAIRRAWQEGLDPTLSRIKGATMPAGYKQVEVGYDEQYGEEFEVK